MDNSIVVPGHYCPGGADLHQRERVLGNAIRRAAAIIKRVGKTAEPYVQVRRHSDLLKRHANSSSSRADFDNVLNRTVLSAPSSGSVTTQTWNAAGMTQSGFGNICTISGSATQRSGIIVVRLRIQASDFPAMAGRLVG